MLSGTLNVNSINQSLGRPNSDVRRRCDAAASAAVVVTDDSPLPVRTTTAPSPYKFHAAPFDQYQSETRRRTDLTTGGRTAERDHAGCKQSRSLDRGGCIPSIRKRSKLLSELLRRSKKKLVISCVVVDYTTETYVPSVLLHANGTGQTRNAWQSLAYSPLGATVIESETR